MEDWTSGYIADLGYTFGYYGELNPLACNLALLNANILPPQVETACELGFGQGVSVNIHAAAGTAKWWGTDFNPSQAGFAQELSEIAGSGARLFDEAFGEFCKRDDLPSFDYIGLHGIWSWINDENRAVIVDFLRRKLKIGGVLYVSYNTLPGWSGAAPIRDLLTEHSEVAGSSEQGLVGRIDAAIGFAQKLLDTNPAYLKANPQVAERFKKIAAQNRNYLAHEFFNRDWEPMPFSRMAKWLAPAKLGYACSASYFDHVDALSLTPPQQALIKDIRDPLFRQTVRDFCVNQQFRKDYWVKGARALNPFQVQEALRKQSVVLVVDPSEVKFKVKGPQGEVGLNEEIYKPLLEVLSDHQPKTVHQLEQSLRARNVNLGQLLNALVVLAAKSAVLPTYTPEQAAAARQATDKLNQRLMNVARGSNDISALASPVTGGAVAVSRFQQLFLLARAQGAKTPEDWAKFAWRDLSAQGQRLLKDGKALATAEENIAELVRQANELAGLKLKMLEALQIV